MGQLQGEAAGVRGGGADNSILDQTAGSGREQGVSR